MLSARQQHCLRGIGIASWRERVGADSDGAAGDSSRFSEAAAAEPGRARENGTPPPLAEGRQGPAGSMTGNDPVTEKAPAGPGDAKQQQPLILESWDAIVDSIHACQACELAQNCTQKVPGVGDRKADLLIVGEGPGHDEDIRGEPFVGRSGQLLDRMLATIGISREQVYITNIVKCRPPNNRDPKPEEALHCRAYLEAQIAQIAPKIILSVGRVSAHNLLGSTEPVGKLIRQMHRLPGTDIPLKVTYHPAYLLRNPSAKPIAWQDLKLLHQMLR